MPDDKPPSLTAVAEIRGFFEIFLPGLFLLLHIVLFIYCASPAVTAELMRWLSSNLATAASVMGLPAGYVLGFALRLGRTTFADKVSGRMTRWLRGGRQPIDYAETYWNEDDGMQHKKLRIPKPIRRERFPYPGLMMAHIAKKLPEALAFYDSVWLVETIDDAGRPCRGSDVFRFNFLKTLLGSLDDRAAKDIFAMEMMVRHAAHLSYALLLSTLFVFASAVISRFTKIQPQLWFPLLCLTVIEATILLTFLLNLRLLRLSEVELVFFCCYRNGIRLKEQLDLSPPFRGDTAPEQRSRSAAAD